MRRLTVVLLVMAVLWSAPSAWAITESEGWVGHPAPEDTTIDITFEGANGLLITSNGTLWQTTDAGGTWAERVVPEVATGTGYWVDACWADADTAWLLSGDGELMRSDDAGLTWDEGPVVTSQDPTTCMAFSDALHGWVAGLGYLARTEDGGNTWVQCDLPLRNGSLTITAVAFESALEGVVWTAGQGAAWTDDGGVTWHLSDWLTFEPMYSIAYRTPLDVWAVGVDGQMARSLDGGRSWDVVPPITSAWLSGIEWFDAETAIAAGEAGVILQTDNAGVNWHFRTIDGGGNDVPWISALGAGAGAAWIAGPGYLASMADPSHISTAPVEFAVCGAWNRMGTSVRMSHSAFVKGEPEAVVVAGYTAWPDALTAAPLAAAYHGPTLLASTGLGSSTTDEWAMKAELARLDPDTVFVVGGLAAADANVETAIHDALPDAEVVRLAGRDRYETAKIVAEELASKRSADGQPLSDTVYLASGGISADALAVGPVAAATASPILLLGPGADGLPEATRAALLDHHAPHTTIIGGASRVSNQVEQLIDAWMWTETSRIAGVDRYHTSVLVAEEAASTHGFGWDQALVCRGDSPWDALCAGPVQARRFAPVMLLPPGAADSATHAALKAHAGDIATVRVAGGLSAVSIDQLDSIEALFR
ncbi:MAG: cell wall-binding repeat-containing protein [Coriobacteriia bacterium]